MDASSRRIRRTAVAVAGSVIVLLLSACASTPASSPTGASDVTAFEQKVQAASADVTDYPGPQTPISVPKNLTVGIVSCSQSGGACPVAAKAAEAAATELGWKASIFDGQGNPAGYNNAVMQAVAARSDIILTLSVPTSQIASSLPAVRESGATIVGAFVPSPVGPDGLDGVVQIPTTASNLAAVDWAVADSGGTANILFLALPQFDPKQIDEFQAEVAECSGCSSVDTISVDYGSIATKLAVQVKSALLANPQIDYVISSPGSFETYVAQAINETGRTDVKSVYGNCQQPAVTNIRGSGPAAACFASGGAWIGWAALDLAIRLHQGAKVEPTQTIAGQLFDTSTIYAGDAYTGPAGYQDVYRKLWGLK
jgi:ribose transport system substrate-binding protein